MNSRTTDRFRKAFESLPAQVRQQAREAYRQFQRDPHHPGLHFKRIQGADSTYSVRISLDYRAVGTLAGDTMLWLWIGSHSAYDNLLRSL